MNPNSRRVGGGLCGKSGTAYEERRVCPKGKQGPDSRGSDIPLHCSHSHRARDKRAQPCGYLTQRQEHQRSRCPLLPAAHVLEVGKLFLAEIQQAPLPAKVFIAEEVRELLGALKSLRIPVNSKLLQHET